MYSEDDLNQAVKHGVFKQADVTRFRHFIEDSRQGKLVDEEQFKFITGFNDIFVVIACLLFVSCSAFLAGVVSDTLSPLITMIISWGLAEYFSRVKKMSLPSIVLVILFIASSVSLVFTVLDDVASPITIAASAGAFGALMAYVHWRRFGVPITLACVVASFAYTIIAGLIGDNRIDDTTTAYIALGLGVAVLSLAVFWDVSDKQRTTKRSDVAFWLHLAAAPLIVHSIFSLLDVFNLDASFSAASIVLVVYVGLALVSITLDRRALMVSSLFYVLYVYTNVFSEFGFVSSAFAVSGVIAGLSLILLSAFWSPVRTGLLNVYPSAFRNKLPVTQ